MSERNDIIMSDQTVESLLLRMEERLIAIEQAIREQSTFQRQLKYELAALAESIKGIDPFPVREVGIPTTNLEQCSDEVRAKWDSIQSELEKDIEDKAKRRQSANAINFDEMSALFQKHP